MVVTGEQVLHIREDIRALADTVSLILDKVNEHDARFDRMDQRFEAIDTRLDRMDQRFDGIDTRLDRMDQRFDGIDTRLDRMDQRFDGIDTRMDGMDGVLQQILALVSGPA